MKAQLLQSFDGPAGFELHEVEPPVLRHPTDVRIRVEACGICYRDITWSRGKFGGGELPRILGHEGGGTVLEAGSAVEGFQPGDRVVHVQFPFCGECEACRSGRPSTCLLARSPVGECCQGCYAEEVVLPANLLAKVPDGIPIDKAAFAACTLGTAYHALRLHGFQAEGKTVAINGAGGGVGIHAVQVARLLGARVIAITGSPDKEPAIRAAGADEVVVSPAGQYRKAMGDGADLFVEIVGAPVLRESLLSVKRGGRLVLVGNPEGGTCEFNPALLIVRGELMMYGTLATTLPELNAVLGYIAQGKLSPILDRTARLEDLPAEMSRMERRSTVGRVVVTPG